RGGAVGVSPPGPVGAGRVPGGTARRLKGGGDGRTISRSVARNLPKGEWMRIFAFVLIGAAAAVVMTATSALADSPHFISADNSIDTSTGALVTSFKDAGLGTGTS